ncbi:OmpA family protein [Phenylobacterium sp. LjRoot219]|uniref:OmpA family protein n=1 Tax=Phenylobacterium sp. LjRoot219 TaxID=3342283 RepID=UPI003ECC71C1
MLVAPPFRLVAAWLAAAVVLAGCTTSEIQPQPSQAVAEVHARRATAAGPVCPQTPLNAVSPVMVGFAFNDTDLTEAMSQPLIDSAQWIACHPAIRVVIKPDSDTHGTPADQDSLARRRAERVRDYLTTHGVAADRIQILPRGQAAPVGEIVLVNAEGRRW